MATGKLNSDVLTNWGDTMLAKTTQHIFYVKYEEMDKDLGFYLTYRIRKYLLRIFQYW